MQHRGTARRRVLIAEGDADLPAAGTAISAGGREIGALGSVAGPARPRARADRPRQGSARRRGNDPGRNRRPSSRDPAGGRLRLAGKHRGRRSVMAARTETETRAWQRMLSGRRLDLLDPSPLDIEIEDIAHGLARVARWNGQTHGDHAYSVAQHSLLVEQIFGMLAGPVSPEWHLIALLHDAPEYVIGDMISPFKAVMGGAYKGVETRLQQAIHLRIRTAGNRFKQTQGPHQAGRPGRCLPRSNAAGGLRTEARPCASSGARAACRPMRSISTPARRRRSRSAFLKRFAALEAQRASRQTSQSR